MHAQTAKLIGVVAQNLPEMSDDLMQGWIENPKGLQKVLKDALCPPEAIPDFKVWKTIKLGTGPKTAGDFRKAIKDNKMRISDWASDILGKPAFTVAAEETELDLVVVSVAELGFKNGATREQIYARAKELDLDLCPAEVGPQLRLQDKDQPNGEWLVIAMEPITASAGRLRLFSVERRGSGLWLGSDDGYPGSVWDAGPRFVFSRRK